MTEIKSTQGYVSYTDNKPNSKSNTGKIVGAALGAGYTIGGIATRLSSNVTDKELKTLGKTYGAACKKNHQ